jgi:hypothetical protein
MAPKESSMEASDGNGSTGSTPRLIPHVLVAMDPENNLYIETYKNGSRIKIYLTEGREIAELRQSLQDQRKAEQTEQDRRMARDLREAQKIRAKVFARTVEAHGANFATRVGLKPTKAAPYKQFQGRAVSAADLLK